MGRTTAICLSRPKGIPIDLLALCTHVQLSEGHVATLTEAERTHILSRNEGITTCGLRVIRFSCCDPYHDHTSPPDHLIWLGMIGMADPVRPDIKAALRDFQEAGIRTVMVTGDQAGTAAAIARETRTSPTTRAIDGFTFFQRVRRKSLKPQANMTYSRVLVPETN